MRVRVGDVIEPAALRCNVAYREFFDSMKLVSRGINKPHNYEPKVYRSEQYNCQMNELMFQAGIKGMSERSKLIPCIIYNMKAKTLVQVKLPPIPHSPKKLSAG